MPLPVPTLATVVPGGFITSAGENAVGPAGLGFSLNVPVAVLYQAVSQSIPTGGSGAAITFDSESLDSYGGHSTSTNSPHRSYEG